MNHDDELDRDLDLESRLHRISQDPEPQVSGRVYRYVQSVASGAEGSYGPARSKLRPLAGPRVLRMPKLVAVTGLAAALVLAIAGTLLITTLRSNGPAATPRYSDLWSALEWHDITSTAFPASSQPGSEGIGSGMVVAWKGSLLANPQENLWSSTDRQTWRQLGNVPKVLNLLATKDWLLGIGLTRTPCNGDSPGICQNPGAIWYSADGVAWKEAQVPFPADLVVGSAANNTGAVVLASPYTDNTDPMSIHATPYASTDGATWAKAIVPADMAGAIMATVTSTRAGFVVSGFVADPAGNVEWGVTNASGQLSLKGFERYWFSADGLAWSTYDPGPAAGQAGFRVYGGSLGDAMSPVFDGVHSADGLHWTTDDTNLSQVGMIQESSDGTEILVQGEGPVFTVGLGDGRWQRLQNVGDIGSLPRGGQSWVVPGGVIYDGGGRVYYGKALTGVTPTQTLHPGPTITLPPGPTLKPLPSVSLAPAAGWSDLGVLQKLPDGPAGVSSVAAWAHGYVAVRNAPAGGKIGVWTSPDGRIWTLVPTATFTGSSAVVAANGDSVDLASWNDGNGVWVSADGTNWTSIGGPPIGDRPMVGDGRGMVAVMDDPQYQLVYSGTGSDTWYTTTLPGASVDNVQSVALSGDRFVAVGRMPGSGSGTWAPAAWTSTDGATWTESLVPDATGEGFVSVVAGRNGFVATSKSVDGGGAATLWSSPDGATWRKLGSSSSLGPDAILAGDGTHILGCDVVGGTLSCWSSLDGEVWTSLPLQGDTSQLVAARTSLRVFPLRDGVLFVTADGVWFGQVAAH